MSPAGATDPPVRVVRDAQEGGSVVADLVCKAARDAIAARGRFTLAIPGGSSPRTALDQLARPGRQPALPWEQTHLLWVDERAVPPDHQDSNFGAFAHEFLPRLPIDLAQVHRIRGELGPHDGAMDYRRTLATALGASGRDSGALDAVVLGIGEDGHIASLFPGSSALAAQDTVIGIIDSPKPPPGRITLTLPVLLAARRLVVLGYGQGKADAVARALSGEPLPARLCSRGPNASWVIDAAAAAGLPPGSAGR